MSGRGLLYTAEVVEASYEDVRHIPEFWVIWGPGGPSRGTLYGDQRGIFTFVDQRLAEEQVKKLKYPGLKKEPLTWEELVELLGDSLFPSILVMVDKDSSLKRVPLRDR